MLYVTALRYSEPYFSNDVSSIEHVIRTKDEGFCTMTQNICFFGIVNCEPLVTRKIIGKNKDHSAITTVGYLSWDTRKIWSRYAFCTRVIQ